LNGPLASVDKPKVLRWVGQTIAFKPILLATGLSLQLYITVIRTHTLTLHTVLNVIS